MGLAGTLCYLLLLPLRPLFTRLKAGWKRTALLGCAALFLLPLPLLALLPLGQGSLAAAPTPVYSVGRALGQAAHTPPAPTAPTALPASRDEPNANVPSVSGLARGADESANAAALPGTAGAGAKTQATRPFARINLPQLAAALLVCGDITAPVLAGVWRSRILLPEEKMRPDALRFALRHERCHHKNGDLLIKYLLLLVGVLHWYSPAAHLLRRAFAEACEQACDEAVTAGWLLPNAKTMPPRCWILPGPLPVGR